ncbi:2-hydroxy-4-carboxymuconate semialdehyde hemiacetal dehydrogenase [Variovorax boronicumulans]|uniref:Gfo/Idh/MocA family oxidoreductase n=1 Tax=Variovorax boronicumulans TaxID=436515 RepID=UPI002780025E|nr:Gfo/Idh/MocA family oxidoreductase [Variovorax boronicumulans]MDQ0073413.1 2-hydroxy-4-carboxymuconate semialdehyde hemiacetal dehydrogenase [Variovorax boronicumulans]
MRSIQIAVAGIGAFGVKHLDALRLIEGVEVVSLIGGDLGETIEAARRYGIPHATTALEESLALSQVEAVILCTPTPLHAAQAVQCLSAGKHVQVEIPLGDRIADIEAVAALQASTGLVGMCGHTRRFNPSHQWIHRKVMQGEFALQHLDVQTYFFRRTNMNALGKPRSWTDHLLWHHAAHTVDLFMHQSQGDIVAAHAMQGPVHPDLGIAMDMSIQLKGSSGALCTLALSFNNKGPLGSVFRYIGDSGTYVARYDELVDGEGVAIDVSGVAPSLNGIELQDREFLSAIRDAREPQASVQRVLPCYRVLAMLEESLRDSHGRAR